jgi:uncharacterized protein YdeI (YjbR/CyaY-like superfamily)
LNHLFVTNGDSETIPIELLDVFDTDPGQKAAFYKLTPGLQRGYIIHISSANHSQTRVSQIEKYRNQILLGFGMHD